MVALGAALVWHTHQQVLAARATLDRAQSALRDATLRLQRSGDEKEVIERYLGTYQALGRAGFVGDEQRINWVEALRQANQPAELFGVEYQIAAQQPYPYAADESRRAHAAPVGDEAQLPPAARGRPRALH